MVLPENIQAAIFDLDGTLLDSMNVWAEIDRNFLAKRGLDGLEAYTEAVKTLPFPEAAAYTVKLFSLPESPEEIMTEWMESVREAYTYEIRLKPYAREFLHSLAKKNIKLGIATSSKPELCLPALKREGIFDLFSCVLTTEEIGCGKDLPHIYMKVAKNLGVSPQNCAVFEDIPLGIKSAKAGGFYTVAVFDEHSAKDEKLLLELSDLFIRSFEELLY